MDSKHINSIISLIWKNAKTYTKCNLQGGEAAVITLGSVRLCKFAFAVGGGAGQGGVRGSGRVLQRREH